MSQVANIKIAWLVDDIHLRAHYISGEGCRIRLAIKKIL
jgi:hypothetical protein